MDKKAVTYGIRLMTQRILGLLLFLLGSWWICDIRAGIYFAAYIVMTALSLVIMYKVNSTTIAERGKISTNSPIWDKVLLALFWFLAYFFIYFAAGKGYKPLEFDTLYWLGIIIYLMSGLITIRAMMVNTFLESTARLQKDRKQKVCTSGPYSIVRHPTYLGVLMWCAAMVMIFPKVSVALIAFIIGVIIFIRTYFEDTMLKKGLEGYIEYTAEVKYRLIPFIW